MCVVSNKPLYAIVAIVLYMYINNIHIIQIIYYVGTSTPSLEQKRVHTR